MGVYVCTKNKPLGNRRHLLFIGAKYYVLENIMVGLTYKDERRLNGCVCFIVCVCGENERESGMGSNWIYMKNA